MSHLIKQLYSGWRPSAPAGRGDKYLADHAKEIRRVLAKSLAGSALGHALSEAGYAHLSLCLVELAEDLHNDIGLWRAVEAANHERFQTPLPFLLPPGSATPVSFDPRRFQYYLYLLVRHVLFIAQVGPQDASLKAAAEAAARYFQEQFPRLPADSGVKRFLAAPHDDLGAMEAKLVWFARHSYLLRNGFFSMVSNLGQVDGRNPLLARQFGLAVNTVWAGKTPADLLADVLALSAADRADLAAWKESPYCHGRELATTAQGSGCAEVVIRNLLDNRDHAALLLAEASQATVGRLTRGPSVPWRGRRYWVNLQTEPYLCDHSPAELASLRRRDLLGLSTRVFALFPELEAPTRAKLKQFHAQFTARHGGDRAVFRTGREAAEAWLEQQRFLAPGEDVPTLAEAEALLGEDVSACANGVAVFSDSVFGLSFVPEYDHVTAGLNKTPDTLTPEESRALSSVLVNSKSCPSVVRTMATATGTPLLLHIMGLAGEPPDFALAWLLGTFKGAFAEPGFIPNLCLLPPASNA